MSPWKPLDDERGPRPVKASLDRVVQKMGGMKAASLEAVFEGWDAIVGEAVAATPDPHHCETGPSSWPSTTPPGQPNCDSWDPKSWSAARALRGPTWCGGSTSKSPPEWSEYEHLSGKLSPLQFGPLTSTFAA